LSPNTLALLDTTMNIKWHALYLKGSLASLYQFV